MEKRTRQSLKRNRADKNRKVHCAVVQSKTTRRKVREGGSGPWTPEIYDSSDFSKGRLATAQAAVRQSCGPIRGTVWRAHVIQFSAFRGPLLSDIMPYFLDHAFRFFCSLFLNSNFESFLISPNYLYCCLPKRIFSALCFGIQLFSNSELLHVLKVMVFYSSDAFGRHRMNSCASSN